MEHLHEGLVRVRISARLVEAEQQRRGRRFARAERTARRAEQASRAASTALARAL